MKTRIDYEAADIDLVHNDLHRFLDGAMAGSVVIWTLLSHSVDGGKISDEQLNKARCSTIAGFLSILANSEWELVKKESSIPPAFRDGFIEKD
jgi:hypothetical protein